MTISRLSEAKGVLLCTSTTRPLSPAPGDRIYETDTGKELTYQGATDTWTLPWGLPWGEVASVVLTASTGQTTMATGTDITGLTVTWTSLANRKYRITASCELVPSATTLSMLGINVTTGATQGNRAEVPNNQLLGVTVASIHRNLALAAGSNTTKVTAVLAGTGTLSTANFASTRPAFIVVDDLGPNGAPS